MAGALFQHPQGIVIRRKLGRAASAGAFGGRGIHEPILGMGRGDCYCLKFCGGAAVPDTGAMFAPLSYLSIFILTLIR